MGQESSAGCKRATGGQGIRKPGAVTADGQPGQQKKQELSAVP